MAGNIERGIEHIEQLSFDTLPAVSSNEAEIYTTCENT